MESVPFTREQCNFCKKRACHWFPEKRLFLCSEFDCLVKADDAPINPTQKNTPSRRVCHPGSEPKPNQNTPREPRADFLEMAELRNMLHEIKAQIEVVEQRLEGLGKR